MQNIELKTAKRALDASTAVPGKYDGYFSLASKAGYSGVAVYTNSHKVRALKAEEGLSGGVQPKPPLTPQERVSQTYPAVSRINLMANDDGSIPSSLLELDKEGRALVLDFGMFVLINVYCVADSADVRYHYKMNFYYLLQERVRILIEEEGREVIVLGDLNSTAAPIDHVEAGLPKYRDVFYEPLHRSWLRDWISPVGPLVDIVRERFPTREGMYTCWNTKINAREGNYGTRIDLILITPGLRQWVKEADIQPSIKGSDHCPVFIDLYDSITDENGRLHRLSDHLHDPSAPSTVSSIVGSNATVQPGVIPRICARQWDEFSAKQTLLSTYFSKPKGAAKKAPSSSQTGALNRAPSTAEALSVSSDSSHVAIDHTNAHNISNRGGADVVMSEQTTGALSETTAQRSNHKDNAQLYEEEMTQETHVSYSEARGILDATSAPEGESTMGGRASSPLSSAAGDTGERCVEDGSQSTSNDTSAPIIERSMSVSSSGRAMGASSNPETNRNAKKRKRLDDSGQMKRVKTDRDGQSKLSSFFQGKPSGSGSKSNPRKSKLETDRSKSIELVDDDDDEENDERFQRDLRLATMLSQSSSISSGHSPTATTTTGLGGSKDAWSNLLGPLQPPNCIVHNEPTKMLTVNKPGPNKGKTFFVCSRWVFSLHEVYLMAGGHGRVDYGTAKDEEELDRGEASGWVLMTGPTAIDLHCLALLIHPPADMP
ncbi:related to APN2-AP endonuclease, exonuclease III homolog [Serendipita indica DSM 11827]|uniref:DNA-(apurinic or apyrimidinic site) endonuclease 2 n=1 Tax=Serendipita indica (strain DSM 11827) TaxID=1109443 RepID=G4TCQ2_SERID|nr:related to APN2-AP endonuclease, exonuclease III homolog [Serendipita indica DSM 11827]